MMRNFHAHACIYLLKSATKEFLKDIEWLCSADNILLRFRRYSNFKGDSTSQILLLQDLPITQLKHPEQVIICNIV